MICSPVLIRDKTATILLQFLTWMGYACIQFSFLRFMRDKLSRVVGSKNRKNDFYIHLYKICLHPDIFYSIFIYQQGRKGKPRAKFSNFPFVIPFFSLAESSFKSFFLHFYIYPRIMYILQKMKILRIFDILDFLFHGWKYGCSLSRNLVSSLSL